ncbi:MAG: hypothetical protein GVY36_18570 [Verrucomicrobia bacterium]|jgi:hypothetical protein|nr:hypothetical protein [Verrucomicrobiota bacterium]
MRDIRWHAGIIIALCIPCLAIQAQYDEARLIVDHAPKSVTVAPDFDRPILHKELGGQSVDLRAVGVAGKNVDYIQSTEMRGDPNGLLDTFTNGATKVDMTTDSVNAGVGAYPISIGGKYQPVASGGVAGGGGDSELEDWQGLTETEVVSGGLIIDAVVRGESLPHSVPPGKTRVVQVTFSEALEGQEVTFSIEGGSADHGTATIEGEDTLAESGQITVKGGDMTEDDHAGNLKIVGKIGQNIQGESPTFSVCAHIANLENSKTGCRGDGALQIDVTWESDSDDLDDLDKCFFREYVTYPFGESGAPAPFIGWKPQNPTVLPEVGGVPSKPGLFIDTHSIENTGFKIIDIGPAPDNTPVDADQQYQFNCHRCESNWINTGPYIISRATIPGPPRKYQVKKTGNGLGVGVICEINLSGPIAVIKFTEQIPIDNDWLVTLDSTDSYDIDGGNIASVSWVIPAGTSFVLPGENENSPEATVLIPKDQFGGQTVEFQLTVTDNDGNVSSSATKGLSVPE